MESARLLADTRPAGRVAGPAAGRRHDRQRLYLGAQSTARQPHRSARLCARPRPRGDQGRRRATRRHARHRLARAGGKWKLRRHKARSRPIASSCAPTPPPTMSGPGCARPSCRFAPTDRQRPLHDNVAKSILPGGQPRIDSRRLLSASACIMATAGSSSAARGPPSGRRASRTGGRARPPAARLPTARRARDRLLGGRVPWPSTPSVLGTSTSWRPACSRCWAATAATSSSPRCGAQAGAPCRERCRARFVLAPSAPRRLSLHRVARPLVSGLIRYYAAGATRSRTGKSSGLGPCPHEGRAAHERLTGMPPSCWAATAAPCPPVPEFDGSEKAETVVIGAGYTGLSAACTSLSRAARCWCSTRTSQAGARRAATTARSWRR